MARIFVIEGRDHPDVVPNGTVDDVRRHYTTFYADLANAETITSKRGNDDVFEFRKRVGTKG